MTRTDALPVSRLRINQEQLAERFGTEQQGPQIAAKAARWPFYSEGEAEPKRQATQTGNRTHGTAARNPGLVSGLGARYRSTPPPLHHSRFPQNPGARSSPLPCVASPLSFTLSSASLPHLLHLLQLLALSPQSCAALQPFDILQHIRLKPAYATFIQTLSPTMGLKDMALYQDMTGTLFCSSFVASLGAFAFGVSREVLSNPL